jgi:amino acid adenylation domain-containing protein
MSRKNVEDVYPLSPLQQGLFFHTLYAPQSGVYVEQLSCILRGELHLTAFEQAWQQVLDRHPILRTAFIWKELAEPVQVVRQRVKLPFRQEDWRSLDGAAQAEQLDQYLKTDRTRGFDLSKAPLMRLALIRLSEDAYQFVWTYQHLLLDGWCIPIVMNEVFAFYEAASTGRTLSLARTRPYRDYIAWLKSQDLTKAEAFWRETLKGFSAPTPLSVEKPGGIPASKGEMEEEYEEQAISLSEEMTGALVSLAREHQLTLNTLVQGAWAMLLSRYSGEQDVVFGITVAGRPPELAGVESMVGLFINTLPVRVRVNAQDSLLSWLRELQDQQIELRQYEYSPLVQVQGWSDMPRGLPLFESLLVFENYPMDTSLQQRLENLEISNLRKIERTNYPLTVLAVPGASLALTISYDSVRFDSTTIKRMLGHLRRLLEGIISNSSQRLLEIPLLTTDEQRQLLEEWNQTGVDYPREVCLHELFEEQAERTPETVALVFEDQQLSYRELNRRANRLAHHLQAVGVGAETVVGIMMERSVEMVVGLLGILKAGGCYLPLDAEYPGERLSFMLDEASVRVLLTQERFCELVQELSGRQLEVLYLDVDQSLNPGETRAKELSKNPGSVVRGENPAYLIYTSGSTGHPKGVLNTHEGICNRLLWMQDAYRLTAADSVLQKTPYSFDVSVWEFFWPLMSGARLVLARPGGHQDAAYLVRLIAQEQITTLHFVPSMLQVFLSEHGLENCRSLRQVMCSGEALSYELQERFFARFDASLHNLYGPTEAAVDVTYWSCERKSERHLVPIGKPIANIQVYILDQHLRPVPVGVAGHLHIGGIGLARGYWDRPELTAEKFIPHPFSRTPGARLYRTGDRARSLSDGAVEYLGRLDYQVKVRGFRIELGEIEALLVQHESVRESVALVREETPGEPRLVAYVVPENGSVPPASELRGYLRERLPEYMLPAAFVELAALPLTPNGKIDRAALPVPEFGGAMEDDGRASFFNPLEEVVAGIWAEVLKLDRVSSHDNFFELGGHSLLAVKVISRLRTIMHLEVPVRALFESPTVYGFTKRIEALQREEAGLPLLPLLPFARDEELPLSFAQQRLWFLDQLEPGTSVYNIPAAVRISGALNIAALEQSFEELTRRHEVLRTNFHTVQGQPQQIIAPVQTSSLRLLDLRHLLEDERESEVQRIAADEAQRPFDLATGPLLRNTLLQLSDTEHVLLLTMHHIISDGWSIEVLLQEMAALYEAFCQGQASPLAELPIQYADFAYWQRRWLDGEVLERQLAYWKQQLGGTLSRLELPTKRVQLVQPSSDVHRSAYYSFDISGPLSGSLKSLTQREGVTMFMTLLAVFKLLLYRYTGQEDIVVGSPVANRNRTEIEKLIGFFVNVLVLRADLSGNPTFRELLAREREIVLGAYAHQDVPFEKLVEELPNARSTSRMPLHQVAFVFQHQPLQSLNLPGLTLKQIEIESRTAKNELVLFVNETEHGLAGLVQYDADLFEAETINRMFRHFAELLETLAAEPDQRLKTVELFREEMAEELALPPSRMERIAPLTPTQRDLYLAHLIDPDITVYSDGVSVNLGPELNVAAWQKAVRLMCEEGEVTRTRFFSYRGEAYQFVEQDSQVKFEFVDLFQTPFGENNLDDTIRERVKVKYNLKSEPLLSNVLVRDRSGQYIAVVAWYHILFDAYSLKLFLESVISAYRSIAAGREPVHAAQGSFYDYVGDCLARFDSPETRRYWTNKLSDVTSLEFPLRLTKGAQSVSQRRAIAPAQLEKMRAFCEANDCGLPAYFRALYGILLSKYLNSAGNFVVYDVIGGRPKEHARTLGCFYQVVPTLFPKELCESRSPVKTWLEYARNYRTSLGPAQDISVFLQKRILKDERLKFFYNFYNFSVVEIDGERRVISHYKSFPDDEVHFIVDDLQDRIELVLHYHESHFHDAHVLERILSLSEQIIGGAEYLRDLDIILEDERRRLLSDWNETRADYRQGVTLPQLFEEQAERTPESVALVFEDQQLSYRELNRRANGLAHHLQAVGVGAETVVGIMMERSVEMVVGLLGILKAGGCYLPLDAEYPGERLSFMLDEARVRVLLTQEHLLGILPAHEAKVVCPDRDWEEIARHSSERVSGNIGPENVAYVIYTSGSTGHPKGAMNTHEGICNRLLWMQDAYRLTAADSVLQKTPYSFDVSVWEFFWPLMSGARLVLARPGGHQDAAYLVRLILDQKITVTHFVPAMLNVFLAQPGVERCESLRRVICSGEALSFELQERFFARLPAELENLYGPTEASIDVTFWTCQRVSEGRVVPIGHPIANTQIYLLGRELQLVPPGATGELYIGGDGLARGYLSRPELTAERFIPDMFGSRPGARLYRTGDLARYLPDGAIEYLGRTDFQVKIRGFRIELGEIETALRAYPSIGEAVVVARVDENETHRLVAYYTVAEANIGPTQGDLRGYLKERLPEYMLPAAFVELASIPLTPNGKIDRRALPAPASKPTEKSASLPARTPTEERLSSIWCEVLRQERVSVSDNFFELGGHSLLATQVVARVREAFDVELPLRSMFEAPTVAGLAQLIDLAVSREQGGRVNAIVPVAREGELPLSFAQQRLWFLDQLEPGSPFYNIPGAVRLHGSPDAGVLERSLNEMVRRHEALRTTFKMVEGQPQQFIAPAQSLALPLLDLQHLHIIEMEEEVRRLATEEAQRPFDLANGPLMRGSLLRLGESEYVLLLTMHHIISDGWSMTLLIREVTLLYQAFKKGEPSPLADLPIQYVDFAHWQREWLQGAELEKQLAYWRGQLDGSPPLLELPTDRVRPSMQSYRGASHSFIMPAPLADALKALSQREGVTMFMTLLAAFNALLSRYTGQEDIVVGSPIANRRRAEIEELIGFFVNTLALRADLSGGPTFLQLLRRMREVTLGAYEHQDLPFEKLVEELQPERNLSYSPLFQVMFDVQSPSGIFLDLPGLKLIPLEIESRVAKFDLALSMMDLEDGLKGLWEYNTDLFDASTIERMTIHLQKLMQGIVQDPEQSLNNLPLLTDQERHQVLTEWNETSTFYPPDVCLHELFEEQAERTPFALALVSVGEQLTYEELNRRANQLAHYLRERGVGPDVPVGLCVERSIESLVGMLGILKAGGAYVPLDPAYPRERLAFMLSDARPPVLLTQSKLLETLPAHDARVVCLDADWQTISRESAKNPRSGVAQDNLAYIIYTSGSTGRPKGVLVSQGALVCHCRGIIEAYGLTPADRVLQFASLSFDVAAEEIFPSWLAGASVVLPPEHAPIHVPDFLELIARDKVTVINLPATYWHELARELSGPKKALPPAIRLVIAGSEKVSTELLSLWKTFVDRRVRWMNAYGLTEATVTTTVYEPPGRDDVDGQKKSVPIGRPLANRKIYILDAALQPVPPGVRGEIYIGGATLARGYLNHADLTAEKFIPDPFSEEPGARLYRTGDLGRYLKDGNIEFLDRSDTQVKVRGFRIELGEIEAVLSAHPELREAAVMAQKDETGDVRLVAYVVPHLEDAGEHVPQIELWPSVGEYQVYDELMYYAMTSDELRVDKYRTAIERSVKDKTVLEIGTGKDVILARLCVAAGARKVYAIEALDESYVAAQALVKSLGLTDKITLIKGYSFDVSLSEKVDVCVSEIIGTIGGSEGVVPILNDARRFLKEDGVMIPQRCMTRIAAVQLPESILESPRFSELSGKYVEKIFHQVGHEFDVRVCLRNFPQANLLSDSGIFEDLDFKGHVEPASSHEIILNITESGRLDGFLLWINLQTAKDVVIDNLEAEYSWLPVYFPVFHPGLYVNEGDVIKATCRAALSDNGINPDYKIAGVLLRQDSEAVEFAYDSSHHQPDFKKTDFYRRLFSQSTFTGPVSESSSINARSLRAYLSERLPDYMLPSVFVNLPSMPLMPSGKIDRRALPAPERMRPEWSAGFIAPRNPIEEMLAGIWCEVLKLEEVSIDANFFELGGHSLLATQVISRVREVFQVDIPLHYLFEARTIAGLSLKIEKRMGEEQESSSVPLVPVPRDVDLPLSFVQQRFWFLQQLMPESSAYNISSAVRLKGALDVRALERSFGEIVRRHEILRTTFHTIEGRPVQAIKTGVDLSLPLLDLRENPPELREMEARRLATEEARRPFDLAQGPLMRVRLLRLETDMHILILTLHHIVSDGWSTGILIHELTAIYEAFTNAQTSPLAELPIQYADFAYWQREWLKGDVLESRLAYWKRQFGDGLTALNLPTDRPRPPVQTSQGSYQSLVLSANLADAIKALGQRESVTLFMTLLAAFKILLHRYTEQPDIVVGSSIANRNRVETEGLIGLLINTLVLRTDLSGDPTFRELLARVREVALGAYTHQDLPFEQLLEELRQEWDASRAPVFQVAFQLQNFSLPSMELKGLTLSPMEVESETAKFDLSMSMMETETGLTGMLEYSTDLFDAATIRRMLDHFQTLLENIVADADQRISALPIIGEDERHQLLVQWNNPETDYSEGQCLHEIFEKQAERTPDAVVLVFEERRLSYRELNARANRLAHHLRGLGVGPEMLVGVCLERSVEMVLAILGILKAGGAYVPLDPAYPRERLAFMLSDARPSVLLTQSKLLETLPAHDARVVCLDADWQTISRESAKNPRNGATPRNLAYIIYTSGSTGQPKGTLVSHENVFYLFEASEGLYHFDETDVWTLFHSYAFDFSVWELWGALLYGGRLVLVPYWASRSPEAFYKLLCDERVTVLNQTPSAFRQLMRVEESAVDSQNLSLRFVIRQLMRVEESAVDSQNLSLRFVIFGGEALELHSLQPWFARHGDQRPRLVNMYGITETTVHVTSRPLNTEDAERAQGSLIGRPITCLQVYILDQHQRLSPMGVAGEICVGGTGLARGYHQRAELTAEKFIPNPFSTEPGARLYRSGDRARYLPNGEMEYLGRIDSQVKIRGYRIEPGEIEAALAEHPSVHECVVLAREDTPAEKRLVAYVVYNLQTGPTITELRDFLQHKLPEHMVPSAFVFLDQLPLTLNGKVDRKALPAPDNARPELSREFVAPRSPVEMELAKIWRELLGVEEVGIYDNFFELGGHSLLLTQLASWIRKAFQVEVPLRVLFDTPTIIETTKAILTRQVEQESETDLAQMLKQLKQLSPHEVKSMLDKMGNSR